MQAHAILQDIDQDGSDSMSYGDEDLNAVSGPVPMPGNFGLMDLDLSDLSSSDADADLDYDEDGNKKPTHAPIMDTILEEDSIIERQIEDQSKSPEKDDNLLIEDSEVLNSSAAAAVIGTVNTEVKEFDYDALNTSAVAAAIG
jgi:hypothetical protein